MKNSRPRQCQFRHSDRTPGRSDPLHELLLACIHPVMHHRNIERLLWIHDVHLLASEISAVEFDQFAALAVGKRVSAISAQGLARAQSRFGTPFLTRRWRNSPPPVWSPRRPICTRQGVGINELISSVQGLPGWTDRVRLLREVLFPSATCMFRASWPGTAAAELPRCCRFSMSIAALQLGKVLHRTEMIGQRAWE